MLLSEIFHDDPGVVDSIRECPCVLYLEWHQLSSFDPNRRLNEIKRLGSADARVIVTAQCVLGLQAPRTPSETHTFNRVFRTSEVWILLTGVTETRGHTLGVCPVSVTALCECCNCANTSATIDRSALRLKDIHPPGTPLRDSPEGP